VTSLSAKVGGCKLWYHKRKNAERLACDPREEDSSTALQDISNIAWIVDIKDSSNNRSIISAYVERSPELWGANFPVICETVIDGGVRMENVSIDIMMVRRSDMAMHSVVHAGKLEELGEGERKTPMAAAEFAVTRGCIADVGYGGERSEPVMVRTEFDESDPSVRGVMVSVQLVFDSDEPSPSEFARSLQMLDWGNRSRK
jgi:hypothetical protein